MNTGGTNIYVYGCVSLLVGNPLLPLEKNGVGSHFFHKSSGVGKIGGVVLKKMGLSHLFSY